jgi:hypothetical protein
MASTRLSIYLTDHLAASVAANELARRSARSNRGNPFGRALDRLTEEIQEDRSALRRIMDEVGARPDPAKTAGAWWAEKLGRLKLNGGLISYSPLSRLVELEILTLGVEGKLRLWRSLQSREDLALESVDLQELIRRARSQLRRLERCRLEAVQEAF